MHPSAKFYQIFNPVKTLIIKFVQITVLIGGVISATARAASPCDLFVSSEEVKQILDYLNVPPVSPPAWHDYEADKKSYILQSAKTQPGCIIPIKAGKQLETLKLSALAFPNPEGQYNLYQVDSKSCPTCALTPEFDGVMRKLGIDLAVVYNADLRVIASYHFPEYVLATYGFSNIDAQTVVHEGFHVNGQILPYIDNRNPHLKWPLWADPTGGARKLAARCYKPNPEVKSAFRNEAKALISAVQLAMTGNITLSMSAARHFIALRDKRRLLISNSSASELAYCKENEAIMELLEGSANWMGDSSDLATGKFRVDQVINLLNYTLENMSDEYFYWFGEYQLFLMWKLFPTDFPSITYSLVTAENWTKGIEAQFRYKMGLR